MREEKAARKEAAKARGAAAGKLPKKYKFDHNYDSDPADDTKLFLKRLDRERLPPERSLMLQEAGLEEGDPLFDQVLDKAARNHDALTYAYEKPFAERGEGPLLLRQLQRYIDAITGTKSRLSLKPLQDLHYLVCNYVFRRRLRPHLARAFASRQEVVVRPLQKIADGLAECQRTLWTLLDSGPDVQQMRRKQQRRISFHMNT